MGDFGNTLLSNPMTHVGANGAKADSTVGATHNHDAPDAHSPEPGPWAGKTCARNEVRR